MKSGPSISVVMPVFNGSPYFAPAVDSILAQTVRDFELVIVDDGSTDDTLSVARCYANRDGRVKVLHKEKTALGDTRNQAVRASSGELVFCMDADDVAEPDRLARQIDYMSAHPECVGMGGHVRFVDEWNTALPNQPMQPMDNGSIVAQLLRGRGSAIWQTTFCMRRWAFDKLGGYESTYNSSEDLDLYLRMSDFGLLANISDILVTMRRYATSISAVYPTGIARPRMMQVVSAACVRKGIPMPEVYTWSGINENRDVVDWRLQNARFFLEGGMRKAAFRHWRRALMHQPFRLSVWTFILMMATPWKVRNWRRMLGRR